MTINGVVINEKRKAGELILDECKKSMAGTSENFGEYKGFKMSIEFDRFMKEYNLSLKNNATYSVGLGESDIGNITRIDNEINFITNRLSLAEKNLVNVKNDLEKAKVEITKPFEQEQELKDKLKRLNELNKKLNLDEKTNDIMDEDEEIENDRQMYKNDYER